MNITTQRNLSKVNEYISRIYPPEKSRNGISRPSAQSMKAGIAYLALMSGDTKRTRAIAEAMFGKRWCSTSSRFTNWMTQGKSLLIQHAPDALPQAKAYNLVLKLKGARGGKI